MRMFTPVAAMTALILSCGTAFADSAPTQQPMSLDAYRLKAALPPICAQIGGKIVYGVHATQCEPPQVTNKTPTESNTIGRAAPISARH